MSPAHASLAVSFCCSRGITLGRSWVVEGAGLAGCLLSAAARHITGLWRPPPFRFTQVPSLHCARKVFFSRRSAHRRLSRARLPFKLRLWMCAVRCKFVCVSSRELENKEETDGKNRDPKSGIDNSTCTHLWTDRLLLPKSDHLRTCLNFVLVGGGAWVCEEGCLIRCVCVCFFFFFFFFPQTFPWGYATYCSASSFLSLFVIRWCCCEESGVSGRRNEGAAVTIVTLAFFGGLRKRRGGR